MVSFPWPMVFLVDLTPRPLGHPVAKIPPLVQLQPDFRCLRRRTSTS
jgi:hypothetical protein